MGRTSRRHLHPMRHLGREYVFHPGAAGPRSSSAAAPHSVTSARSPFPVQNRLPHHQFWVSCASTSEDPFLPMRRLGASGARVERRIQGDSYNSALRRGPTTTQRRLLGLVGAGALALAFAAVGVAPAHGASNATVSILHGVPDATVDVYANGKALLENFEPGTLTDPQMLPAGSYDLKVVKAGDGPDGDAIMSANNVKVPGGANVTVVAHLTEGGKPTLTPYANDVSALPAGKARVIVRHAAAAPEVDVRAGGEPVFTDLANPKEESAEIDPGTVKADVVLAGTDDVVIGPASLKVAEGTTTIVYAWGSAEDENLKLAVQAISGMDGSPNSVPGGTGGQAASSDAAPLWAALVGVAALGAVASGWQLSRRRAFLVR